MHLGTCGIASGAEEIKKSVIKEIEGRKNKDLVLATSGCVGYCELEPMMTIEDPKGERVTYHSLTQEDTGKIFSGHIDSGIIVNDLDPIIENSDLAKFYDFQESRVLHNRGRIDPFRIEDYISYDGYRGLFRAIELNDPQDLSKLSQIPGCVVGVVPGS